MKKMLIVVFVLAFSTASFAYSGNELLSDLNNAEINSKQAYGLGYVSGAADAFLSMQSIIPQDSKWQTCIPEGVTQGQFLDIVKKFIRTHPNKRHRDANFLIMHSIRKAFPCE